MNASSPSAPAAHVYLDWNATAPLAPEARAAWLAAQTDAWANPASIHGPGQRARNLLDQSRATCARLLHCHAHELVWVSGGTEANATAIHAALADGKSVISQENTAPSEAPVLALAAGIEHSSVLRNLDQWCLAAGGRARFLPVDADGRLSVQTLVDALAPGIRLVCLHAANNELGTLQDLPALIAAVRAAAPHAKILVDCCQGAGKIALDLTAMGADFASIAGHKFGAPRGIGLLHVRSGVACPPLIAGGRQQQDRRSGSEDVANAAALAAALSATVGDPAKLAEKIARQRDLLETCWQTISTALPHPRWLAHAAERLPNTMNLVHPHCRNDHLVMRLDLAGIAVSTGAACMAARGEPSHVVAALGLDADLAKSAVRVSIGPTTTAEDLARFAAAYITAVTALTYKKS